MEAIIAMAYMVTPVPEEAVQQQREAFAALLENLGASPTETRQALAERKDVTPESELNPDVVARLRQRIADASASG